VNSHDPTLERSKKAVPKVAPERYLQSQERNISLKNKNCRKKHLAGGRRDPGDWGQKTRVSRVGTGVALVWSWLWGTEIPVRGVAFKTRQGTVSNKGQPRIGGQPPGGSFGSPGGCQQSELKKWNFGSVKPQAQPHIQGKVFLTCNWVRPNPKHIPRFEFSSNEKVVNTPTNQARRVARIGNRTLETGCNIWGKKTYFAIVGR